MSSQTTSSVPVVDDLTAAFRIFTDASNRLEHRYAELQREAEELREQLRVKDEEIKRGERLTTLGQMAAALAHEIRNPLGAMKLFLSLLKQEGAASNDAPTIIAQMDVSIESLDAIVSNILHFAKGKVPILSAVNVTAVVEGLLLQFRQMYPNVSWSFDVQPGVSPFVRAGEQALRQVFHNLLLNGAQAMRGQGACTVHIKAQANETIIEVEDNGPGVAEAVAERLFEPFVTTKNEGTGLGLAVVKQILEQHGARILVRSGPTKGAVFSIHFPNGRKSE